MNLSETIEALEKGKRIRQSNYAKGVYLFMDEVVFCVLTVF